MHHREFLGQVISDKMDKTAVVTVKWSRVHPLYQKRIRKSTRFYVHDPKNECHIGDTVRIIEIRPLSKTKRWLLKEIILRRNDIPEFIQEPEVVAEVEPEVVAEVEPEVVAEAEPEVVAEAEPSDSEMGTNNDEKTPQSGGNA